MAKYTVKADIMADKKKNKAYKSCALNLNPK